MLTNNIQLCDHTNITIEIEAVLIPIWTMLFQKLIVIDWMVGLKNEERERETRWRKKEYLKRE